MSAALHCGRQRVFKYNDGSDWLLYVSILEHGNCKAQIYKPITKVPNFRLNFRVEFYRNKFTHILTES